MPQWPQFYFLHNPFIAVLMNDISVWAHFVTSQTVPDSENICFLYWSDSHCYSSTWTNITSITQQYHNIPLHLSHPRDRNVPTPLPTLTFSPQHLSHHLCWKHVTYADSSSLIFPYFISPWIPLKCRKCFSKTTTAQKARHAKTKAIDCEHTEWAPKEK